MAENPFETLKNYQIYRIDGDLPDGRGEWFHCLDDAQAIEWAKANLRGEPLEVWQGSRQVERLEPERRMRDFRH